MLHVDNFEELFLSRNGKVFNLKFYALSDRGKIREKNEDSWYVVSIEDSPFAYLVADGMGGLTQGEMASNIAVEYIGETIYKNKDELLNSNLVNDILSEIIKNANEKIYNTWCNDSEQKGMGTTLSLGIIIGNNLTVAQIGDSRVYLAREEMLTQLTVDHSYVEELKKQGLITEQEAREHPKRNIITRALGYDPSVEVDFFTYELKQNDVILFCTDGLTSMLKDEEILSIINEYDNPEDICSRLVSESNQRGGTDNITVIVVKY